MNLKPAPIHEKAADVEYNDSWSILNPEFDIASKILWKLAIRQNLPSFTYILDVDRPTEDGEYKVSVRYAATRESISTSVCELDTEIPISDVDRFGLEWNAEWPEPTSLLLHEPFSGDFVTHMTFHFMVDEEQVIHLILHPSLDVLLNDMGMQLAVLLERVLQPQPI